MDHLDHGGVQPYAEAAARGGNALAAVRALPDNGGRRHVAGLQRMHERLAVAVHQHSANGTHLLRHQSAEELRRVSHAGGMVLDGILVQQGRAHAVAKHQAVSGGAVVVGGGESLVVQPSRAAGGDDHHLGSGHQILSGLHILEHSARNLSLVVQDQAHDLSAGVVRAGVHTLSGGAAAVGGHHGAVGVFIEHNA